MSINSMTNSAAARRADFAPFDAVPANLAEIAKAAARMPSSGIAGAVPAASAGAASNVAGGAGGAGPGATTTSNPVNTAMQVLFGYIPTEVLTLYVAVLAALHPSAPTTAAISAQVTAADWINFYCFLVATPVIFWVVYATKLKAAGKNLPLGYSQWPVWEMFAATVAYVAWAFALPGSPFREFTEWYSAAIAGVAVLVVSTVLGLLAPLFQNKL